MFLACCVLVTILLALTDAVCSLLISQTTRSEVVLMSIFQDNNVKIHQAQTVKDCPPQSPDLIPIESL